MLPSRDARRLLGVSATTLRKWAVQGIIPTARAGTEGKYIFDVQTFLQNNVLQKPSGTRPACAPKPKPKKTFVYARVSTSKQTDDLQRQVDYIRKHLPNDLPGGDESVEVITDVGSGINFKRPGLRALLEHARKEDIHQVYIAHKDRLCRFAYELVSWLVEQSGGEIVVLDQANAASHEQELANDLLAIVHVFSCRANRRRSYKAQQGRAPGRVRACGRTRKETRQRASAAAPENAPDGQQGTAGASS